MKKIKWLFFIVSSIAVFVLGAYILYEELHDNDMFWKLKQDPSLYFLVFSTILSITSLFFNLEKIAGLKNKTDLYKITRIGDMLFAIYFFVLGILAAYTLFESISRTSNFEEQLSKRLLAIGIIVLMFFLSILLFIDNFKFHRSFKKISKGESIEDIGS